MIHETDEGAVGDVVDLGIDGVQDAVEIGRGGFGVVYRATETELGRSVAVKVLSNEVDEQARSRFDRERKAMGALSGHPHIVNVFYTGVSNEGAPYIVMEFLSGGTMTDRLRESGKLSWDDSLAIGVQLASALETAHRAGVLHRDVKPSNVLIDGHETAKLGDFGIARLHGGPETKSAMITASIAHAPPEVISGQRPDARSDVYSLASTMYQLLTGTPAFSRPTDESLVPMFARIASEPIPNLRASGIPDPVAEVMEKAMAKTPADRFETALEFGRALNDCQRRMGLSPTALMVEGERTTETPNRGAVTTTIQNPPSAPVQPGPQIQAPTPMPTPVAPVVSGPHPVQPAANVGPPTPPPFTPHSALTPPAAGGDENRNVLIGGAIAAALIVLVGIIVITRPDGSGSASPTTETVQSVVGSNPTTTTTTPTTASTTTTTAPTTTTTTTTTTTPPPVRPAFASGLPDLGSAEPVFESFATITVAGQGYSVRVPTAWNDRTEVDGQVIVSPDLARTNNGEALGAILISASQGIGVFDAQAFLDTINETLDVQDECDAVSTRDYQSPGFSGLLQAQDCNGEFGRYAAIIYVASNPSRDVYLVAAGEAISERDLIAIEESIQSIQILDRASLPDFTS